MCNNIFYTRHYFLISSSTNPTYFTSKVFFYESNIWWWHEPLLHNFIFLLFNKIIFHWLHWTLSNKNSFMMWGEKNHGNGQKVYCFSIATVIWSTWNDEGASYMSNNWHFLLPKMLCTLTQLFMALVICDEKLFLKNSCCCWEGK